MQTKTSRSSIITPFDSNAADISLVGGKASNLVRLVKEGFPVPDGFIINTGAYQKFLTDNQLFSKINPLLLQVEMKNPDLLENISRQIRLLFSGVEMSSTVKNEILSAYSALTGGVATRMAVAVRSSATAEDLPDMSFAGQQDTYLNIIGEDNLLEAVVNCWSSLWTARAIGYRSRNNVDHFDASLAVIVQKMVESQASGVLFTANPLTGLRTETIIDATFGLGEALVSGQVEPDHYVISRMRKQIISKYIGKKELTIHGLADGGTKVEEHDRSTLQVLPDEQILALSELCDQIESSYGFPQDIEWAWAQDQLFILQTRPITSLFPVPEGTDSKKLKIFFSLAAVQGMLDPLTPLGADALKELFAAGSRLFGINVTRETQTILYEAAERLWVNFTTIMNNSTGRRILPNVFAMIEPAARQAIEQIIDDPQLQPGRSGISLRARLQIARFLIPMAINLFLNLIAPAQRRKYIVNHGERMLRLMKKEAQSIVGDRWQKLDRQADLLKDFGAANFPYTFLLFVSGVAAGMASWNFLNMLADGSAIKQQNTSQENNHDLVLR